MILWAVALVAVAGGLSWWKWARAKPISADASGVGVPNVAPIALAAGDDLRMIVGGVGP